MTDDCLLAALRRTKLQKVNRLTDWLTELTDRRPPLSPSLFLRFSQSDWIGLRKLRRLV